MQDMKFLWSMFCCFAGTVGLAFYAWTTFESVVMAILGAITGAILGIIFSKYISLIDILIHKTS